MKVLALAHQYVPVRNAGAETMLHGMLSALVRAGHDVHASLSMQVGEPYVHEGVKVWPRSAEDAKAQHLDHLPADVLVSHLDNCQAGAFLAHLNDIPSVVIQHNTFDNTAQLPGLHGARVDLAVANSHWMADTLEVWRRARDVHNPRTIVVRPLVDRDAFRLDAPGDRVTLINLRRHSGSRDGLSKGGELFWKLAARMPKTKFLGVTGSYGEQATGNLPNVEVVGHVPATEMREQVYARTRVLLVPSSYESWGRVATEAVAAGIPVICTPTPGLKENLGPAGIYLDPDDVDGYVRALRTLALPGPYAKARRLALGRADTHEAWRAGDEALWVSEVERLGSRAVAR